MNSNYSLFSGLSLSVAQVNVNVNAAKVMRSKPAAAPSSRHAPTIEVNIVGLEEDVEKISERLCADAKELQILPIVGTGGIGKTTLARKIYHDPSITARFDVLAWVTVSQDYSVAQIFANLLISLKDFVREEKLEPSDRDKVYKALKGRTYLIVVDDMWNEKTWDEVKNCLPDDRNRSRILMTTRLEDVAVYAGSSKQFHKMQFMDEEQSWVLLKREVFKGGDYSQTLETKGREIAKSCGGLPLAIVVIAGLLLEVNQTEADWEQIAHNINLAIQAEEEKFAGILTLSYTHLPDRLKHCFLYMSAFPEDYEIHVSKLIKLWVAEGFIRPEGEKSAEKRGEEFLQDLVKRNLVLVNKRKSNGNVKSCVLHDLLRDLCLMKSLEEDFLLYFMGKFVLPEIFEGQRRISVLLSDNLLEIGGSTIETIICYQRSKIASMEKFRMLKILDMVNADLPFHIFEFRHLKHIAFSYPVEVPLSISNLHNLESLMVYPSEKCMVTLPVTIWKMSRLRHLIASCFNPLPNPDRETPPLEDFQTLSLATNFVCSETMVRVIPNVKKLGICYSEEKFDQDYHLDNLQRFDKLEKLKLEIRSDFPFVESLNPAFPMSLIKLTLSGWRLPWEKMSVFGLLPELRVLKLRNHACDGTRWETNEGEFEKLEFLLIDESNLQEWSTDSTHFRVLKWVVLHRCPCLREIPDAIGDIPTLKLIELDGRNKSLVKSAERIISFQETEYENHDIKLRY